MDYRKKLIDMIQEVENEYFILFIYNFARRLRKNWGV